MNHKHSIKFYLVIISFSTYFSSQAQIVTKQKLLGCWKASKYEFLEPVKDSADLIKSFNNYVLCFEKNGKFTTTIKSKNRQVPVGTGTYRIGSDGKTIYQKRDTEDDGVDSPAEVVILTELEFAVKADNAILHFVKVVK